MNTAEPTGLSRTERVAVARLRALVELLPVALDRRVHALGLTAFEYTLLEALAEAPGHRLRLTALARRTNATLPRLSRVVSGLERKGLLDKRPCPADARATNAILSPRGERTWREAAPVYGAAVKELVLAGLGDRGVEELAAVSLLVLRGIDPEGQAAVATTPSVPATRTVGPGPEDPGMLDAPGGACCADPDQASTLASAVAPAECGADPGERSGEGSGSPGTHQDAEASCGEDPGSLHDIRTP